MFWIKRFIISFQIVLVFYLLSTISLANCNDKKDVQTQANQRSSESVIVSLINNIIKLKDVNLFRSGIESSLRSVFKKPLTSAVYALSMLVGVVAMLAFYESPVSPMPVPPLPDPPVGRFPPEHPIWPPPPKDPVKMSDKKRVGGANAITVPNSYTSSSFNFYPPNIFPNVNPHQKYSEKDPTGSIEAYQQLVNLLEKRISNVNTKQNKFSGNSLVSNKADVSAHNYPIITVESNPKVINQSLYSTNSELNPNDRHESIDFMNRFYHKSGSNDAFDKLKDFTNINKISNSETNKESGDKFNQTSTLLSDSNSLRKLKNKNTELFQNS